MKKLNNKQHKKNKKEYFEKRIQKIQKKLI